MNPKNRRQFLKSCCAVGAAGMAAHMTRLAPMSLVAQSAADYKALVCVFLFGGNDANNMMVPIDSRYAAYQAMRGSVALAAPNAANPDALLPAGSSGYGVHPRLPLLRARFEQNRVAMVFNVGTLYEPMTRTEYRNGTKRRPVALYSHSDQTQQWQTSIATGGATGWGGRLNDVTQTLNGGTLPPGVTVQGGSAMFLNGVSTQGMNYSNPTSFGLTTFGPSSSRNARLLTPLQNILTFDTGVQLVGAANGVLGDSIRSAQEINAAVTAAPPIPAGITFPNTGLGNQLRQVAQLIAVQGSLNMSRQIFFAGTGGFDNHENLVAAHNGLMNGFDQAVDAFMRTLEARGQYDRVTLFTESEFNRTADANANNGTDHAWGTHCFVVGGAVQGGTHGTFPLHQLNGPDDAGDRGYWIPTTSTDQYGATLGRWFGASDAQLASVFPNLGNFPGGLLSFV
jgi:uncharacterized protein (DUF1501 family)